jgi:GPI-anchor transamidase subunit S
MSQRASTRGDGVVLDDSSKEPKNVVKAATARVQPPPETPASISLRRWVVLSFWGVVIFLGLPIWWKTTTIYRASLPLQTMIDWAEGKVCSM